jgi:inner membrane protein
MCTPIGHALAGYAVLSRTSVSRTQSRWMMLFFIVLVANLPDIDFLFGWSVGNPNRYHHLWTHSIVFAVLTGVVVGAVYSLFSRKNGLKMGGVATGIVGLHLVLDFLSKDTRAPNGMPLFWPISGKYFLSPVVLFLDVHKASSNEAFFGSLFCWHNLWTLLIELAILMPPAIWMYVKYGKTSKTATPP